MGFTQLAIVLVIASPQISQRSSLPLTSPVAGASCAGSSLRLAQNFPVDTSDDSHQIVNIETVDAKSKIVGWIYTEENGDRQLEFSSERSTLPGAFGLHQAKPLIFIPLTDHNTRAYIILQRSSSVRPCFSEYYHPSG